MLDNFYIFIFSFFTDKLGREKLAHARALEALLFGHQKVSYALLTGPS